MEYIDEKGEQRMALPKERRGFIQGYLYLFISIYISICIYLYTVSFLFSAFLLVSLLKLAFRGEIYAAASMKS